MTIINLNIAPYYDDYNPDKDYLRVLFRPGYPVQARELTTLQTMLQEQISRFGDNIFKDGSRVTGASINVDNTSTQMNIVGSGNVNYPVGAEPTGAVFSPLQSFVGLTVTDATKTIKAKVLALPNGITGTAQIGRLYLKYISATSFEKPGVGVTTTGTPLDSGYLYALREDNPDLSANLFNVFNGISPCTLANIAEGVYYVAGEFVRVAEQTVVVSETTNKATAALGFTVTTSFVSANDDPTLYDNARNTSNEGAPGANRLKLNLAFSYRSVTDNTDPAFYRVIVITNGVIQEAKTANPQYAELLNTLARRTYDESGNYALNPFVASVKNEGPSEDTFRFSLGASKAYVQGYEIQTLANTDLVIDRGVADTSKFGPSASGTWAPGTQPLTVAAPGPSFIKVSNVLGTLPGFNSLTSNPGQGGSQLPQTLIFYTGTTPDTNPIGQAHAWGYDSVTQNLYMYDVQMYQTLTVSYVGNRNTIDQGVDITDANGNTGYLFNWNLDPVTLTGTVMISNTTGTFVRGPLTSTSTSVKFTALTVAAPSFSAVNLIASPFFGGFSGRVAGQLMGSNQDLFYPIPAEMKTTLGTDSKPVSNLFNILAALPADDNNYRALSNGWSNGPMGVWRDYINREPVAQINKNLNFALLRIRNTALDSDNYRTNNSVNYGWSAQDKQISLYNTDIQTVYGVFKSSQAPDSENAPHPLPKLTRINITGPELPVGYIITGRTSGTKAVVAASNNSSQNINSLIGLPGWHESIVGTGDQFAVDVIFTSGTAFTPNEQLVAVQQSDNTGAQGYSVNATYVGIINTADPEVTSLYLIDDGQRGEYYDTGRLVLKEKTPTPSGGDLYVFFSYFTADSLAGGFYNVDSYASAGFFDNDVRYYGTPQDIVTRDPLAGYNLRNYIDYRQRVQSQWNYRQNSLALVDRTFLYQSHVTPLTSMDFSGEEYLGRIDTITLDKDGVFRRVAGVASLTPQRNVVDPAIMTLNYVAIPPAVRYPTRQVTFNTEDNRRYTMRDIGALAQRLDRVESTVTLSLLESQALNDSTGDSRIRMGFLVDDFTTPDQDDGQIRADTIRDAYNPEFNASVDIINKEVRAGYVEFPIAMELNPTSDISGIDSYYLNRVYNGDSESWRPVDPNRGSFIVKRYTQVPLFGDNWQKQASSFVRINPYATWVYTGQMTLTPKQDAWRARRNANGSLDYTLPQIRIPTTVVNGVNVVDPTFFRQYDGVLQQIQGTPFNNDELRWSGRTIRENDIIGSGAIFQSRTVTATRTTISGTRVADVSTLNQIVTQLANDKVVYPEPNEAYMRGAAQMNQNAEGGINFSVTQLRANLRLRASFDGVDVTAQCRQFDANGRLGAYGVLQSDSTGSIRGNFAIEAGKFNIGTRTFLVTDADNEFTTYAAAPFTSSGVIGDFYSFVADQPFVIGSSSVTNQDVRVRELYDPVAQTFTLPLIEGLELNPSQSLMETPGAMITSVDLYFQYVDIEPQQNLVNVQIRNVVNGYPGPTVIGRGRVTGLTSANASANATVATNVRLDAPCFLQRNTEYALVVLSPSAKTTVWVAVQGEPDVATGALISKQPNVGGYYGSFFTSQNNSTWNADQNRDMKFNMYRASFVTTPSTLKLRNTGSNLYANIGYEDPSVRANALETFDNCRYIKVYCQNHGMYLGRLENPYTVTLSNVRGNYIDIVDGETLNGIPVSELNGKTFSVRYPTLHTYFIELPSSINIAKINAGTGGGELVMVTQVRQYDAVKTNMNAQNFFSTDVGVTLTTVNGTTLSFDANDSKLLAYNTDVDFGQTKTYTCTPDRFCEFEKPQVIFNKLNDGLFTAPYSLEASIVLSNKDNTLSPIIATDMLANFNAYRNNISHVLQDSEIGAKLNRAGLTDSDTIASRQLQFVAYESALQSLQDDCRYLTKQVDLFLPATGINISFDADMEPSSSLEFSYKARPPGSNTPFSEIAWVDFPRDQFVSESRYGAFASEPIYAAYTARLRLTNSFGSFQVRVKFRSMNEAQTPRVRALRILAVA